ncbi:MAG: ABC transporter permease [Vicinamibacterales bacterium]
MWLDALRQDVRYAFRTLARSPGFTAVGVLVLALAIGVNTAIFSLVNALIFKGIDVEDSESLRFVVSTSEFANRPGEPQTVYGVPYRALIDLRDNNPVFADAFGFRQDRARIRAGREVRLVRGERVTANYFDALRVRPHTGRLFTSADESAASDRVAVISHDLWKSRFHSDPAIAGTVLPLDVVKYSSSFTDAHPYTIIGVAPPGFRGVYKFEPTEFWVLHVQRALDFGPDPGDRLGRPNPVDSLGLIVALRVTDPAKESEMSSLLGGMARHIHTAYFPQLARYTLHLEASRPNRVPFDRTGRIVPARLAAGLFALAGIVALIGLANLTGLLAARGITRRTEMAVRITMGARGTRLFRQSLLEGLLLSGAAAATALVGTVWLMNVLIAAMPEATGGIPDSTIPIVTGIPLDWRVLVYTSGSAVVAALIIAAVPFRQARRVNLLDGLREGGSTSGTGVNPRLQRGILIPQVCCCVILLVVSGVVTRTLIKEELRPRGYNAGGVVAIEYVRPYRPYPPYPYQPEEIQAYQAAKREGLQRILAQIDSHQSARIALAGEHFRSVPLPLSNSTVAARDGFSTSPRHTWVKTFWTTQSYFDVVGIPIILGRGFGAEDTAASERVAVVSQHLARTLWPDGSAIGQYLGMNTPGSGYTPYWQRVIGVAADITLPLSDGNPTPIIYDLLIQRGGNNATLIARSDGDPGQLIEEMKQLLTKADPEILIAGSRMMSDGIDAMMFPRRLAAGILGFAAACGLLLACVGLYGIVSYSVAQRAHEIGIRAALGAERRDIMRLVLRDGLLVIAIGCAVGLALAYTGVKLVSSRLVALPEMGIGPLVAAPILLLIALMLATYIPARRAAAVDPMIALRRL